MWIQVCVVRIQAQVLNYSEGTTARIGRANCGGSVPNPYFNKHIFGIFFATHYFGVSIRIATLRWAKKKFSKNCIGKLRNHTILIMNWFLLFFAGWQVWNLDQIVKPCLPPLSLGQFSSGPLPGTSCTFLSTFTRLTITQPSRLLCTVDNRRWLELWLFEESVKQI